MKRSIWKKALSSLLVLVMILGLIPMTALAADLITVTTTGATFNTARLDQITPGAPVCAYEDMISTSKGDVYEVKYSACTWYSDEDRGYGSNPMGLNNISINGSGNIMGAEFEAGRTYYLFFTLQIKSEYKKTHTFPSSGDDKVSFTFRNLSSSQYRVHHTRSHKTELYVVVEFTMPGERLYEDIDMVYTHRIGSGYLDAQYLPAVQGKKPPSFETGYNNYTLKAAWEGEFVTNPSITDSKPEYFAAGNIYRLVLTFTAKEGYHFASDCGFRFVEYNSILTDPYAGGVEPDSIAVKNGRTELVVEFEFLVEDYKLIDTIHLDNGYADPGSFYPCSNQSLPDAKRVGYDNFGDQPFENTYTALGFSQHVWYNDKNEYVTTAPERGLVHFGIHLEIDEEKKDYYRFADDPVVLIEGLDLGTYWTEAEFRTSGHYQKTELFLTVYFLADYHLESAPTGSTLENRMRLSSYQGLKFALENPNIHYIEMEGTYDTLPFQQYETADQKLHVKWDAAILVEDQKHLVISGSNELTVEQVDPTVYFPYDDLIRVKKSGSLTVSGSGTLNVNFGQPDYPAAILFNQGTLDVSGVTLFANALYRDVYPQVINCNGGILFPAPPPASAAPGTR